jgi:hypothetical protein
MPKFHFHLDDERDEEGLDLADLAGAKCEALEFAARHICDAANALRSTVQCVGKRFITASE